MNILFLGIGKMGLPMASHLLANGHTVRALDLDLARREAATQAGLSAIESTTDLVSHYVWADYVMSSLPNDEAFLAVASAIARDAPAQTTYIDTSTISMAASTKAAKQLETSQINYLRVAVSGNNHMAIAANLTILASGPRAIYDQVLPLLACWGPSQFYLGAKEQARLMKLVVNLCIAQTSAMLAEGLTLGRLGDLDWGDMWQVLSASAVGSPILKAKSAQLGKPMLDRDFEPTFTVHQMVKDLSLITAAGEQLGAPLAQTKITMDWMQQAIEEGEGQLDYAAIIRVLERQAGLSN